MNARERLLNRIQGKETDRIPNMNIVMMFAAREMGLTYGQIVRNARLLSDGMKLCYEKYGIDCLWTISDPMREATDLGADAVVPEGDAVPYSRVPLVREAKDILQLKPVRPEDGRAMSDRLEAVQLLHSFARGEACVIGWVEGPFAQACDLMGVQEFLMFIIEEPEAADELLDFCVELELQFALAQIRAGADIIGIGDAATSLIGPKWYRELAFERERKLISGIHEAGALAKLHICGNINPFLEQAAQTGCDILDCDYMVDMERASLLMAGKGCVCGNFDPVSVMLQGTPADVRRAALQCANYGTNTIVAAGCEIPVNTAPANVLAVKEALCGGAR